MTLAALAAAVLIVTGGAIAALTGAVAVSGINVLLLAGLNSLTDAISGLKLTLFLKGSKLAPDNIGTVVGLIFEIKLEAAAKYCSGRRLASIACCISLSANCDCGAVIAGGGCEKRTLGIVDWSGNLPLLIAIILSFLNEV